MHDVGLREKIWTESEEGWFDQNDRKDQLDDVLLIKYSKHISWISN